MSCAGYFETLLARAKQESFNNQVLREIQEVKDRYQRKLRSLRVQGCFHEASEVKAELERLEKTEESMKRLLEV